MQYVRRLIICPVVSSSATIIFAPNQLISKMQEYTVNCIMGILLTTTLSALTNIQYRFSAAFVNF